MKIDMQKKIYFIPRKNLVHIVYMLNKKLPLLRC